ncbi:rna-directed dna polymerase from mobile element jockey-like [Willisornis vidua]|uniref:Rna-directed dna polymerase from mobile element jockey-like n=1 Tax=Willisornis vidua TaxID=1566151 RepID=A0ABQ9DQ68_9PASS|nr:rna-directed dna polymerase from mobile element jockey-like [Willisornis vidua]
MQEERDAIQRDLDKLEEWAHADLMTFQKAKCMIPHVVQGSCQYQYRLGDEWIESNPAKKDLEVMVDEKPDMSQQCGYQVTAGDSAPLFCSRETPHGVLHPAPESLSQERHGPVGGT